MPMSRNRTRWPVTGGAIGVQPGWFQGHINALFYINLGDGTVPENYSLIMQPVFSIVGPANQAYNGSFCLPQVPLPVNYTAQIGANATIQIIEAAQHGAALFNVSYRELFGFSSPLQCQILQNGLLTMWEYSVWISRLRIQKMWTRSRPRTVPTLPISLSHTSTVPLVRHPMRRPYSRAKSLGWLRYLLP